MCNISKWNGCCLLNIFILEVVAKNAPAVGGWQRIKRGTDPGAEKAASIHAFGLSLAAHRKVIYA